MPTSINTTELIRIMRYASARSTQRVHRDGISVVQKSDFIGRVMCHSGGIAKESNAFIAHGGGGFGVDTG